MVRLVYSAIASLDGYVCDRDGNFDWAAPDDELHAFVNDLERPIGTYLYGRRMYETMLFWETAHTLPDPPAAVRDYTQIWQAADKIVYSTTLASATGPRTRVESTFDPEAIRALKAQAALDISVGGPGLATHALTAGLVDECHLIIVPVVIGGGTNWLPPGIRLALDLVDHKTFGGGAVHLHYAISA